MSSSPYPSPDPPPLASPRHPLVPQPRRMGRAKPLPAASSSSSAAAAEDRRGAAPGCLLLVVSDGSSCLGSDGGRGPSRGRSRPPPPPPRQRRGWRGSGRCAFSRAACLPPAPGSQSPAVVPPLLPALSRRFPCAARSERWRRRGEAKREERER